jgi:hypothetical protein
MSSCGCSNKQMGGGYKKYCKKCRQSRQNGGGFFDLFGLLKSSDQPPSNQPPSNQQGQEVQGKLKEHLNQLFINKQNLHNEQIQIDNKIQEIHQQLNSQMGGSFSALATPSKETYGEITSSCQGGKGRSRRMKKLRRHKTTRRSRR